LIPRVNPERGESVATLVSFNPLRPILYGFMGIALAAMAFAQEPLPVAGNQQPQQQSAPALASLHGVVRNAASGEPLPRALVSVEGDASTGALTDGDGKFEIPNLPAGPVIVSVRKPGFFDAPSSESSEQAAEAEDEIASPSHNVILAQDMPDVEFSLTPSGAIQGQVDLSNGDTAGGISLTLLRRVLMDGRAGWVSAGGTKTRSDGAFRFGELPPGVYELYSDPSLDADDLNLPVQAGRGNATHAWGFASVYYPDAREPSGASRITVDAGATVQANLTLVREAFQTVTAFAVPPQAYAGRDLDYTAQVMDISGRALPYTVRFDPNSKMIQATLPDGGYRLAVTTSPRLRFSIDGGPQAGSVSLTQRGSAQMLQGAVDVQVAGQPVTNLRVALTEAPPIQVELNVQRSGAGQQSASAGQFVVTATQAPLSPGQLPDAGMVAELASGQLPGPLVGQPVQPGAYWLHTVAAPNGYCESSFIAGGANLAREPLLVGQAGVQAPLELTLRDDCAKLTLSLPEAIAGETPGEEKYYSVFAIPDFDYTFNVQPVTLRPSSGGTITLNGLTPGNYHVYTLKGNASFEYRNPAALAALPSQAVTLSPGATASVVVNVP
jgi:hypothetical protein